VPAYTFSAGTGLVDRQTVQVVGDGFVEPRRRPKN